MSQVIAVHFHDPLTQEKLSNHFTKASSHQEAIELALTSWSGGVGILKEITRQGMGQQILAGANSCWRYIYSCILEGPPDDPENREVLAVLFTTYREQDEKNQPFETFIERDGQLVKQEKE